MKFRAGEFEGPLDLLLHLIRTNEMELDAVSVLDIVDQYAEVVSEQSMEETSEFVLLAAHLIALKARYLNKGSIEYEDALEDDPLEELVERLRAYKAIKEVGEYLEARESTESRFFRESELIELEDDLRLDAELLTQALQRVIEGLSRFDDQRQEFFSSKRRHHVPVKERKTFIIRMLKTTDRINFSDISEDRDMAIANFLALLELLKERLVRVRQDSPFTEIYISAN